MRWLTFTRKLGLATGSLLVVFIIFGVFCIFQALIIDKSLKDITEVKEPVSAATYEMEINLVGTGFAVLGYMHDHDPKHLERIKKDANDFKNFQKKYRSFAVTEKTKKLADKVEQDYDKFTTLANELTGSEDKQTRKLSLFAQNLRKIDNILDDNIQASIKFDHPQAYQKVQSSYELEINVYEVAAGMEGYIRSRSSSDEAKLHKDEQHFRKHLADYKSLKLSPEEHQVAAQLSSFFDKSAGLAKEIISLDKTKEKGLKAFVQIRRELDALLDNEIQALTHINLDQAKKDAVDASRNSKIFIVIGIFLAIVVGTIGAILVIRSINGPLQKLIEATAEIARGNFSFRSDVKSDDEIGILSDSFNFMSEELNKTMVSRDFIQDIIQSMSDAIIVVSPKGIIETTNPAVRTLLGYDKNELHGEMYDKVFPENSCAHTLIDSAIKKGLVQNMEKPCILKDGTKKTFIFSSSILHNNEGVICAIKDVTEIKLAEASIKESEEKLRTTIEASMDAIVSIDEKGNISLFNPAAEELFGYSVDEVLNKPLRILLREDAAEPHQKKIEGFLSKGSGQCGHIGRRTEFMFKKKDGTIFMAELAMAGARSDNKRLVVVSIHDITERKQMENTLRESEERYRSLFEDSKDVVYISNREGHFLDINSAGIKLFGYDTKEEVLSLDIEKDIYINLNDRNKFIQLLEQQGFVKDYELLMKKKNREPLILLATAVLYKDKEKKTPEYRGIMRDITHQKKLEQQLLQSQKMEAVGQLAGGIAHDFNNILTAIIGYASVMKMKMPKDDPLHDYHDYIEQILASSERAASLTQKLLVFSRKQISSPEPANLNEIIKKVEKILSRVISENIDFKVMLSGSDLPAMADAGEIEQALMNLVINARDAMPKGGELTIETKEVEFDSEFIAALGYGKIGKHACIIVSDTGVGIDPSIKEKIFEPFFTTKEPGKGTGLGLSMVYGIVKQHNGHINCYSELGKGTSFKIYLPLLESKAGTNAAETDSVAMPKTGTETILVAEDEKSVKNFIRETLESFGYKIIESSDGEDAVKKFAENKDKIDICVFDVIMPKKGGIEAYKEIKKLKPGTKILFMSGYASDFIRERQSLDEEITLLPKPFKPDDLLMKIREILDK